MSPALRSSSYRGLGGALVALVAAAGWVAPASARAQAPFEGIEKRAAELPGLQSLIVAHDGEAVVEARFRGPPLDRPVNVKSVSKSVLSILVGMAIDDGHLEGTDQKVLPFFERYLGSDPDPAKRRITVDHLLSMRSGLERTSGSRYGAWVRSGNWVRYALRRPMKREPGGAMMYSTGNTHILSAMLTRATGKSTYAYARRKLAKPLGMRLPRWQRDPQGIYFGGNQMRLSPRDMLRFGEMVRNGGRHQGRQIVSARWIEESWTPRGRSPFSGELYGYGWFISSIGGHRMAYAWGYGGQYIFIVPDLALTVVATSSTTRSRNRSHQLGIRTLLSEHIVPAAQAAVSGAVPVQ